MQLIILILVSLANILLGLFVLLKNPRATTNKLFMFLASSFVAWSIVNYLSVHPVVLSQLSWIRLVLFGGGILNVAMFLTFLAFPASTFSARYRKLARLAVIASA